MVFNGKANIPNEWRFTGGAGKIEKISGHGKAYKATSHKFRKAIQKFDEQVKL